MMMMVKKQTASRRPLPYFRSFGRVGVTVNYLLWTRFVSSGPRDDPSLFLLLGDAVPPQSGWQEEAADSLSVQQTLLLFTAEGLPV